MMCRVDRKTQGTALQARIIADRLQMVISLL